jgi:MinD superfamily P-loop ATPase
MMNNSIQLDEYIQDNQLKLLIKIPFSIDVAKSYSSGELPTETIKEYRMMMLGLFDKIKNEILEAEYV